MEKKLSHHKFLTPQISIIVKNEVFLRHEKKLTLKKFSIRKFETLTVDGSYMQSKALTIPHTQKLMRFT